MRLAFVLAALATCLGLAAPAHADVSGTDQAFLLALRQAGVTYADPQSAVNAGHEVCSLVSNGMAGVDIVKTLQDSNPGLEGSDAGKFAAIAASAYCPKSITGLT
jgi:Protein of unknown function (DUF732)